MTGFREQLQAARQAHDAASNLDAAAQKKILEAFDAWDSGDHSAQSVRWQLEAIIRSAYRASAAVAAEQYSRESGIPGWKPTEVFNTQYLQNLLKDVRRNLREYKASDKGEVARRRAVFRMQLSAQVAAQRGFTDATNQSAQELKDFGFQLRKVWLANFAGNTPCEHCRELHGTEVGMNEDFPIGAADLKVYGDLSGPPRHPNCRCYVVILTVSLENAMEALDIQNPGPAPKAMTTDDVKKMPDKIFAAVVKTLRKVIAFVKGSHG